MGTDTATAPRVFISHAMADDAWAEWVKERLHSSGIATSSVASLGSIGQSAAGEIRAAIAASDTFVILISRDAASSKWVQAETSWAIALAKPIHAVLVDAGAALPAGLRPTSMVDLSRTSRDEAVLALAASITGEPRMPSGRMLSVVPPGELVEHPDGLALLDSAILSPAPNGSRAVVLAGPAGVGKSTLAAQFAVSRSDRFSSIHRVAWTGGASSLFDEVWSDPGDSRPTLLIIEDVDTTDADSLLPPSLDFAVLITSRSHTWPPGFTVLSLHGFGMPEAAELVQRVNPNLSSTDAEELLEGIGGFPALLAAAARLTRIKSVDSVLEELGEIRAALGAASSLPGPGFYFLDTDDPDVISEFERAFKDAVDPGGDLTFFPAERGSWRRRFARRYSSERVDQFLDKAERAAEVTSLTRPEGQANRDNAEAIARLLEASASIPNIVVSSGSVFFVKITDGSGSRVFSKTLTATEMRLLEQHQQDLAQPAEALKLLEVLSSQAESSQLPSL